MAKTKSPFAYCKWCEKREFSWGHPVGGGWALYEPVVTPEGKPALVMMGSDMKAQPNKDKRHVCPMRPGAPHSAPVTSAGGPETETAPPIDAPAKGYSSKDKRSYPVKHDVVAATTKPVVPIAPPLPTPEKLLSPESRAAWARFNALLTCEAEPMRILAWGPPGTGKTETPWRTAKALGWTHVYQLMTEETPGTELLGHLIVQAGNTIWCDGTLGRAIRASHSGHVVYVIDEIGRASQDAMSACLLALTNPESLRLTLRTGEVIEPKPEHWHVVATSNDEPNLLPPALADRLHLSIMLTSPAPDLVRSMTTKEARRLACAKSREYSIRALLTYDRLRAKGMDLEKTAFMVWEPAVAKSFIDAVRVEG